MVARSPNIEKDLIFHFERGFQYASKKFVNVLDSQKKNNPKCESKRKIMG